MRLQPVCPVCGNDRDHALIEQRPRVPMLQNTTLQTIEEAAAYPTGQLEMLRCSSCTFVWNQAFDPSLIVYDESYNNDVSTSDYYIAHLNSMADRVLATIPDNVPIHYVEIGCGEGDFLRLVMQRANGRCVSAIGFDPSFTGEDKLPQGARVYKSFFGKDQVSLVPNEANIICSRHTIEHVADSNAFASGLASLIDSDHRRLLIETPDANWILQNSAFQDFFYEHCSIYTPKSIQRLLANHNLSCQVTPVYDGQYMWTEAWLNNEKHSTTHLPHATTNRATPENIDPEDTEFLDDGLATQYVQNRDAMIQHWTQYLQSQKQRGPIAIWGAASKGVTFALIANNASGVEIDFAIDLNKAKQGRFLPTTGLPVISPSQAHEKGVLSVVIMNPNYESEIKTLAAEMNWDVEFSTLNG